jgi:hypothetical protein
MSSAKLSDKIKKTTDDDVGGTSTSTHHFSINFDDYTPLNFTVFVAVVRICIRSGIFYVENLSWAGSVDLDSWPRRCCRDHPADGRVVRESFSGAIRETRKCE